MSASTATLSRLRRELDNAPRTATELEARLRCSGSLVRTALSHLVATGQVTPIGRAPAAGGRPPTVWAVAA